MSSQNDSKGRPGDDSPQEPDGAVNEKETETRPPSLSGSSGRYIHQEDGVTKIEALCKSFRSPGNSRGLTNRYGLWQRMEVVSPLGLDCSGSLRLLVSLFVPSNP